jgi:hypothetical protein
MMSSASQKALPTLHGRQTQSPSGKWQRTAVVAWTILIFLAVGRAALYHHPRHQGCYPVFADGGRHWLRGEDLYDNQHPDSLNVFRYSPLIAAGLVPLAFVPDPLGSAMLRGASLAVFLLGLELWSRAALPTGEQRAGLFLLCIPLTCPSLMDVQLNVLTIGLLLVATAAACEERWWTAALAASLACCLKAYPVSLALVLAALFPRRFAGRWGITMAVCLALPFLLQRPDYVVDRYEDWVRWGLNQRRPNSVGHAFQDFMLLCQRWLVPIRRESYFWVEVVVGVLIALVCLCHRWRGASHHGLLNCVFGLCCGWMMAFGPATEATTYIQLAPTVAGATLIVWTSPQRLWYRTSLPLSL